MRYYKKCEACNGQGKRTRYGRNYHLSISCTCEGGFVDCTSEVEALIRFKDLSVKTFDYPPYNLSISHEDYQWLYAQYEAYDKDVLEPKRKAIEDERESN